MIGYLVLIAVAIGVFAFVLQPLLGARRRAVVITPSRLADLQARRGYLLEAIRDVDFDYSVGKLTEAEYRETRGRFVREAADVLRELDQETSVLDAQIDDEILRLRELVRQPTATSPHEAPSDS